MPDSLLTAPDVAGDVELGKSVSMAMMLVIETLSSTERAVLVLRDGFRCRLAVTFALRHGPHATAQSTTSVI